MGTEYNFCINLLIVDGRPCQFGDFKNVKKNYFDEENFELNENNKETIAIKKVSKSEYENRFIALFIEEGDKYPYPDTVYDSKQSKEVVNPRPPDKIQFEEQLFLLIDTEKSRIYISNQKKKNLLVKWLGDAIGKVLSIKALIDEKEFIGNLATINKICFSAEPNLFNLTGKGLLSDEVVKDIYGFDAEEIRVELIYKDKRSLSEKIINKYNELIKSKAGLKNLTIIGRTDDNIESTFNLNEITTKIKILIEPNPKTKKYNQDLMFQLLIAKIKEND